MQKEGKIKCAKVGPTQQVVGKFKTLYKRFIYMPVIDFDVLGSTVGLQML